MRRGWLDYLGAQRHMVSLGLTESSILPMLHPPLPTPQANAADWLFICSCLVKTICFPFNALCCLFFVFVATSWHIWSATAPGCPPRPWPLHWNAHKRKHFCLATLCCVNNSRWYNRCTQAGGRMIRWPGQIIVPYRCNQFRAVWFEHTFEHMQ